MSTRATRWFQRRELVAMGGLPVAGARVDVLVAGERGTNEYDIEPSRQTSHHRQGFPVRTFTDGSLDEPQRDAPYPAQIDRRRRRRGSDVRVDAGPRTGCLSGSTGRTGIPATRGRRAR